MFTTLFIILTALMALDTVTTYIGMKYCTGTELNPLWRWCKNQIGVFGSNLLMLGVKAGVLIILWDVNSLIAVAILTAGYIYLFARFDNLKVFRCI